MLRVRLSGLVMVLGMLFAYAAPFPTLQVDAAQCTTKVPDPKAYLKRELANLQDKAIEAALNAKYGGQAHYFEVVSALVVGERAYACVAEGDYVTALEAIALLGSKHLLKDTLHHAGLTSLSTISSLATIPIGLALQYGTRKAIQGALEYNIKAYSQYRDEKFTHEQIITGKGQGWKQVEAENGWLRPPKPTTWGGSMPKAVPIQGLTPKDVYELARLVYEGQQKFDADKLTVLTAVRKEMKAEPQMTTAAGSTPSLEEYLFFSKTGAKWVYDVTLDEKKERRRYKGKLTIVNEGETLFEGTKAIRFSWTYTYAGGVIREEKSYRYLVPSPEGVLWVGTEYARGKSRFQPPRLWLKEPLQAGSAWESQGTTIQTGGKTQDYRVTTTVQTRQQATVPAGQFETLKAVWQTSKLNGTTWWAKGIGIVRDEYSGQYVHKVAELVEYSIPGEAPVVAKAPVGQTTKPAETPQEPVETPRTPSASGSTGVTGQGRSPVTWEMDPPGGCLWLHVKGHIPVSIDLADEQTAKALLREGRNYALAHCGLRKDESSVLVELYSANYQKGKRAAVTAHVHPDPGRFSLYSNYPAQVMQSEERRRAEEEKRRRAEEEKRLAEQRAKRRAQEFLSKEIIARQIEGFNLGMDMNQAVSRLESGIQNGKLTPIEVLQFGSSPMFPNMLNDQPFRQCSTKHPGICVDVPVKLSPIFQTGTAEAIQLIFYQSKLLRVTIDPYVNNQQMNEALQTKYGPPTKEEHYLLYTDQVWMDKKTSLTFYPWTTPLMYCCYKLTGSVKFNLVYDDRELMGRLEGRLAALLSEREGEETKKQQTMPERY